MNGMVHKYTKKGKPVLLIFHNSTVDFSEKAQIGQMIPKIPFRIPGNRASLCADNQQEYFREKSG
jgi:hypothetical protein